MKILFVADGRSPIALNWMGYFVAAGHDVHLASTFPCEPDLKFASLHVIPLAFSEAAGMPGKPGGRRGLVGRIAGLVSPGMRAALRHWLAPLGMQQAAGKLRAVLAQTQPELVHAMRIPYDGMLAAAAAPAAPLLVSVWGNDFTLHAPSNPWMGRLTRACLSRAAALHTDCQNDQRLARQWGFDFAKPAIALPGGGGVQPEWFYPPETEPTQPVVLNPRGLRAYVRNEVFFAAAGILHRQRPEVRFECLSMQGEAQAAAWVAQHGLESAVTLLPKLTRPQVAERLRRAPVVVSLTEHDGTPNTLLEALACGCLPVAGDIPALREWITDGENGLLVAPRDAQGLAAALLRGLDDADLRRRAREINQRLIAERAVYPQVMAQAEAFYRRILAI